MNSSTTSSVDPASPRSARSCARRGEQPRLLSRRRTPRAGAGRTSRPRGARRAPGRLDGPAMTPGARGGRRRRTRRSRPRAGRGRGQRLESPRTIVHGAWRVPDPPLGVPFVCPNARTRPVAHLRGESLRLTPVRPGGPAPSSGTASAWPSGSRQQASVRREHPVRTFPGGPERPAVRRGGGLVGLELEPREVATAPRPATASPRRRARRPRRRRTGPSRCGGARSGARRTQRGARRRRPARARMSRRSRATRNAATALSNDSEIERRRRGSGAAPPRAALPRVPPRTACRPPTLTAEYAGGRCSDRPQRGHRLVELFAVRDVDRRVRGSPRRRRRACRSPRRAAASPS